MTTFIEEWRDVPGFPPYQVSSLGRVWTPRKGGRVLKCHIVKCGYDVVKLTRDDKTFSEIGVHRLVAWAFIGPQPPGMQVNHLDGVKLHNVPSNLEYVTPKQNMDHAYSLGLVGKVPSGDDHYTRRYIKEGRLLHVHGERQWSAMLTEEKVVSARAMKAAGVSYREVAEKLGVTFSAAYGAIVRRTWKHVP